MAEQHRPLIMEEVTDPIELVVFMRIDGQWLVCDDGVRHPVIIGEIRAADGSWEKKVTDAVLKTLHLTRHETCPQWHYTIHPRLGHTSGS